MTNNLNRRKDYGKHAAPENVEIKTAKNVEVGDTAVSPSGLESVVLEKKFVWVDVEPGEKNRSVYEITFASKAKGVITKTYTPSASLSVLKQTD